jgi:adenylyltransferase/sulfurtransferase
MERLGHHYAIKKAMLSNFKRYERQILLKEIGTEGQEKILKAKVLVVGAGGLGCPVLQYLVAAGVGTIGVVDDDVVCLSNLQRQVLFKEEQLGCNKANAAKQNLSSLNSNCKIAVYNTKLTKKNAFALINPYDIIIGCTDNFESRIIIDTITKQLSKPFIHGSLSEFEGQVTVFNYKNGASYKELFNEPDDHHEFSKGILGAIPGIIGGIQAVECLKIITNTGDILSGKLMIYNGLNASFNTITY